MFFNLKVTNIVFWVFIFGIKVNAQNTFFKNVHLPIQDSSLYGSRGEKVAFLNGYFYSLNRTLVKISPQIEKNQIYFVKYNLQGDTLFTKIIIEDTFSYAYLNSMLIVNTSQDGFKFSYSRTPGNYLSNIFNYIVYIDTQGVITKSLKQNVTTDFKYYRSSIESIFIEDSIYGIVRQYGRNPDTTSSYLIKWVNDLKYDTIIKKNTQSLFSYYLNIKKLNGDKYVLFETIKYPNSGLHGDGKTNVKVYDKNFKIIFNRVLYGYFNFIDCISTHDTLNILATYSYPFQTQNNLLKHSFHQINNKGDSLKSFYFRPYLGDTATIKNELLYINSRFYIGSQRYLNRIDSNSIKFLRDMWNIRIYNYCKFNDTLLAFAGTSFDYKLSNIGIMSYEGKIVSLSKINVVNQYTIYPNPSRNGNFFINSNYNPTQIKIYNALGQLVFENKTINTHEFETDLNSGIYFLEILVEGNYYYSKWVIDR